ncbi:Ppx/GppA phosphatase family protein [Ferrimicrobium acidiphilum]|uniref:Ppx/GppA phosphatase family protein n=1 Tax=Ferrimicrobium acidiphilum TaxID=121039 RepID=UPI00126A5A3D|nr:Ppx/GppA phosphatase family protein [Ferrimicrobium acidiphilum]
MSSLIVSGGVVVAAMDLGSNSFHLAVFRVRSDLGLEPIAKEREMLRLGERVYRDGVFNDEAIQEAVATVARFLSISQSFGAEVVVAKATASFRDAENAQELIDAIHGHTGVKVQVISGHEEASLVFDAIRAACHLGSRPVLGADLGGGSLELMLGDQRQLIAGRSLRLGVGRLRAKFGEDNVPALDNYVGHELQEPLATMVNYHPTRLILTSGTMNAIGRFALSLDSEHDELDDGLLARTVSRPALEEATSVIRATSVERRNSLKGIDARRATTVGFGAVILGHLLDAISVDEVWLCSWALREGIVLHEAESQEHFAFSINRSDLRADSVRELMLRYRVDAAHANFVTRLALQIFDALVSMHGLNAEARQRLAVAAQLHDIGAFINRDEHDRHGQYLVTASPPRGFTRREIGVVGAIIGAHTKGEVVVPADLGADDGYEIQVGAAIVRLADALDRSHQQLIQDLHCTVSGAVIHLRLRASSDLSAEMYALRRKRRLVESILACQLHVTISDATD